MVSLKVALQRIDASFDSRINAKVNVGAKAQAELNALIGEKEERLRVVREFIQAENDKIRIDLIVSNVPPELV